MGSRQITDILNSACWGEPFTFHPSDAWAVIGKCEIGDMTDVDAIYRIERIFGLRSPCDELWERVKVGLTFGEVVTYIDESEGESA